MIVTMSTTITYSREGAEVRCPRCAKLLLKWVEGTAMLDLKCTRCGTRQVAVLST